MCLFCAVNEGLEVVGAGGDDEEIICECPGGGAHVSHATHPWSHEEREKHHGEGASLRYAIGAGVRCANACAQCVVDVEVVLIVAVCSENGGWKSGDECNMVQ